MSDDLGARLGARTPAALSLALQTWRHTPAPGLAAFIERLSADLAPPPQRWPTGAEDFQARWLELARAPPDELRPALLEALRTKAFAGNDGARLLARLERVARWPADPRTAAALQVTLEQETRSTRGIFFSEPVLRRLLSVLVAQRDPRSRPWLERYVSHNPCRASTLRAGLERAAQRALERLPTVEAPAWVARLGPAGAPPRPRHDPDVLVAAALASPDDRTLREVLLDVLLEVGDPRGPFFALSLAASTRPLTADEQRQHDSLARKLRTALLGALAPIAGDVDFRDGFVDRLSLTASWRAAPRLWDEALASPWLNTVRHLDKGNAWENAWVAVLDRAPRSLRSASTTAAALGVLAATKAAPRLERLVITGAPRSSAKATLARLVSLKTLHVTGASDDVQRWLLAAPALEVFAAEVLAPPGASKALHAGEAQAAVAAAWLARTTLPVLEVNGWRLVREKGGAHLTWTRAPIWGDAEAWALVAFTSAQALKLSGSSVAFAPGVLNLTPALRKALGPLLPAATRRV
ncbi:MAG: hypothetical protein INH41_10295 [Myxococcaceae bacterium]|jgi:hypothetical protein|nr:hypothetical protein [Myxococcaceae bacterium]MCA3012773.1 hypothetical protein [Myxococcaceae bacterium]